MTIGRAPLANGDEALINQKWACGVAGGSNYRYQSGIVAAGSNQAGSTPLGSGADGVGIALYEVDTVASGTGVSLPFAFQGTFFTIYNNGSNTLTVYPAIANNPNTAAQDTIDNTTSFTINSHAMGIFACAKDGVWAGR